MHLSVEGETEGHGLLSGAEWLLLLVLAAVQFTHIMDFMVVMPLGRQYMAALGITTLQFGTVISAYAFSAALSGLCVAWFVDRFDRRAALLGLYLGFTLSTIGCAAAPGFYTLLLARTAAGWFGGVLGANLLAIVGDVFPDSRRGLATGIVTAGFSVASIIGVPAGIFLAEWLGYQAPFAALGLLSLTVWLVAWWRLPPLRGHLGRAGGADVSWRELFARPLHRRAYAFLTAIIMSPFFVTPYLPTYLRDNVGLSERGLAGMYVFGGLASLVVMPAAGRLSDRLGKLPVFRLSAALTVVPILWLTRLGESTTAVALTATTLFFITTSARYVPAMAMVTACALPRYRGRFMSVCSSVQQTAAGLASLTGGALLGSQGGRLTGYAFVGLLASAAALTSVVLGGMLHPADAGPQALAAVDAPEAAEETAAAVGP